MPYEILKTIKPREYQKNIYENCKDKNCLVVLPTGTGKTLIALMLTINRLKKHPDNKVLFLAPTRPLAEQHFNYFTKHLPELFGTLELFTGKVQAPKRKKLWETSDIIFSTPQCISNDLKNNFYNLSDVCLLIEDECHRCLKNYAYNKVAKLLEQTQLKDDYYTFKSYYTDYVDKNGIVKQRAALNVSLTLSIDPETGESQSTHTVTAYIYQTRYTDWMDTSISFDMSKFSDLEKALSNFRNNRKGRSAIPQEIWDMVRDLPESYNVNQIAKPLSLDWLKVKKLREGNLKINIKSSDFLELKQSPLKRSSAPVIITRKEGFEMQIPSEMISEELLHDLVKSFLVSES